MANGTPKPLALVKGHRTKAEKEIRAKAESALLTGSSMRENPEVKANPIAHKEFIRIKNLLKAIQKDDDLSGNIINTHCLLHAECKYFEDMKVQLGIGLQELSEKYETKEIDFLTYTDRKDKMLNSLFTCDKKIMEKRKLILDIAKDNILTIQSALRSVPKKPEKKDDSAMSKFLKQRTGGSG